MDKTFTEGDVTIQSRVVRQEDFDRFAELSGDDNPIHVDPAFAARTHFGEPVAHGMLLYGLVCGVISDTYPDAFQIEQDFMFPAPTFAGEHITIRLRVVEVSDSGRRTRLETVIVNAENEVVCDGETVLGWPAR